LKAIQSPLRFDSCMEHEICFFNSTAQGKHISKVTSLSIHAGRNKEDKKRGIFPLPQRTKKKRRERETGRRSTYMGSGAREGRCAAARRRWQGRGRPLPDQRGRERERPRGQGGGDLGAGRGGWVTRERERNGQEKKTSINLALVFQLWSR
jgi:hypothetical protein